jgi:regulator of RNase E activity RraA
MVSIFINKYLDRFLRLSTTNVSDALDALGLKGSTYGIRPMSPTWGKVAGRAVTLRMTAAGPVKSQSHLGVKAIDLSEPGDIIVIDNGGRLDTSCWGGILANGAQRKGVAAVAIDGACRDLDDCLEIDFPVYARGTVVATARGRVMEESTNSLIQFGGVQVSPGDAIMADRSGVVVVPWARVDDVLDKAVVLFEKEEKMIAEIRAGRSMVEVDREYNYETMLK